MDIDTQLANLTGRVNDHHARIEELEDRQGILIQLVAGGLNTETGQIEEGIARQLSHAITELSKMRSDFSTLIHAVQAGAIKFGQRALWAVGVGAVAIVGWIWTHWPAISKIVWPPVS